MRRALTTVFVLTLLAPAAAFAAEHKEKGTFISVDTLTATVMSPGGRHQIMTVQSGVDCPDPALRDYAEKVTPRLRDALAQELQLYAGGLVSGSPPDADYLARRLQGATDRVLKKPGGRFLLGGIMVN